MVGGPRGAEAGREDTPFQTQTHTLGLDPEKTEFYVFFLPFKPTLINTSKLTRGKRSVFHGNFLLFIEKSALLNCGFCSRHDRIEVFFKFCPFLNFHSLINFK